MTMSVKGTFRSKARRLTSTTSPSSSVGRIDPEGIGFQSATAVRKSPKSRMKTRKPLLLRNHFVMSLETSIARLGSRRGSRRALFAGDARLLDHDRDFGEVH